MSKNNEYVIQYSGLKLGIHTYNFEIRKTFFDQFEYSEIENCNIHISMTLDKSAAMLVLIFDLKGEVTTQCDRCLEDIEFELDQSFRQVVKISDFAEPDLDDEIMVLPTAEYEVDITKFIYDFCHLSLPLRRAHEEGKCNEETIKKLNAYLLKDNDEESASNEETNENKEIDPRWKALMNLKDREN